MGEGGSITRRCLLCFALLGLLLGTAAGGAETVTVTKAFDGREVKVRVGGSVRVELEQPGATGYEWKLKDLDTAMFELVSSETLDGKPPADATGAPVKRVWIIRARERGKGVLRFLCYRSWEGESSSADKFTLTVRVPY